MKCSYCGSNLPEDAVYCGNCGAEVSKVVRNNDQSSNKEEVKVERVNQNETDSGSIGWAVLGFFIPLVGLILYITWKNTKPKCAKMAGTGALIGFCLNIVNNFFI